MEVNDTKTELYNGEESELRGMEGEGIVGANTTGVDIADVINTVLSKTLITDQEEVYHGMTKEVCDCLVCNDFNPIKGGGAECPP